MSLNFTRCRELIHQFQLRTLFIEELGWDTRRNTLIVQINDQNQQLTAIAHKRGMVAYQMVTTDIPTYAQRRLIEQQVVETTYEHLIVFIDAAHTTQIWQWVKRELNKPITCREHLWHQSHTGDALLQKLAAIEFTLDEEEDIHLIHVVNRTRTGFDIERITKKFYEVFKKQHSTFLASINGIDHDADRDWYASVMLNRLMFIYFIQRKGFLDNNRDYLQQRLALCKKQHGHDKFYSFYRYFLLRLFHEGLGQRQHERAPELQQLLGRIPYLNGGLFDIHELEQPERYGTKIHIPDAAFASIFSYFDQYQWHLDERPLRKDNEINPDVLGYIFEKYINQKQMGAYYTKEDITEYISKNTVLPFIFDAVFNPPQSPLDRREVLVPPLSGQGEGSGGGVELWHLLSTNPDRYIYQALRHGVEKPLPPDIAAGLDPNEPDLLKRRQAWNKPAPDDYALPTEIWREVIARRQRYAEVRAKLASGTVRDVNAFITLNLDLRQFSQDVIENCADPALLMALWQAVSNITVLDPTGGSGAFIFAALNILESLYVACLERMEAFLTEWGDNNKHEYHNQFRAILGRVNNHPNRRYFVLKSIILHNLYAVDIMAEAVEICKLRLFLKLAAQVDVDLNHPNLGLEPLPDIDFNIRTGNSLIGYATYAEVKRVITSKLDLRDAMGKIAAKAGDLQQAFDRFRAMQTEGYSTVPHSIKQELQARLRALEHELNEHLAIEYAVKIGDKEAYKQWIKTHQPFHWFIEFYGILNRGGFDVVIGNPPYVEYAKVSSTYRLPQDTFATESCGNLYAFICERIQNITRPQGRSGVIVLLAAFGTTRMLPLQTIYKNNCDLIMASHYEATSNPSVLFVGVKAQLIIILSRIKFATNTERRRYTSNYIRTYAVERDLLFARVNLFEIAESLWDTRLPRFSNKLEMQILAKLKAKFSPVKDADNETLYYRSMGNFFWKLAFTQQPRFEIDGVQARSSTLTEIKVQKPREATMGLIYSNLFYWWWTIWSDVYHVTKHDINSLPWNIHTMDNEQIQAMVSYANHVEAELFKTAKIGDYTRKNGRYIFQRFFPHESKPLIDKIDTVLAQHYGFTPEELDFIINYDIKYRMGRNNEDEE